MVAARPCVTCQQPAFGMQCRACRISAGRAPDESDALTGGNWIYDRRRGVEVYVLEEEAS